MCQFEKNYHNQIDLESTGLNKVKQILVLQAFWESLIQKEKILFIEHI